MLVVFIIVQGPKGEGMINSMNGASAGTMRQRRIKPHRNLRREPHVRQLHADEELRQHRHLGLGGRFPAAERNHSAEALSRTTSSCNTYVSHSAARSSFVQLRQAAQRLRP